MMTLKVKLPKCFDKECQENINMQPGMPEKNMQLLKPAIRRLGSDKNCQSTRCYKKKSPMRPIAYF